MTACSSASGVASPIGPGPCSSRPNRKDETMPFLPTDLAALHSTEQAWLWAGLSGAPATLGRWREQADVLRWPLECVVVGEAIYPLRTRRQVSFYPGPPGEDGAVTVEGFRACLTGR